MVGGLGGIGRAAALWMIKHGARNLIFANRSGLARQDAKDVVHFLQEKGASVAVYACDICEQAQLRDLISQSSKSMPPIRGVIQSAMVLRVGHPCSLREVFFAYNPRIRCWRKCPSRTTMLS